MSLMIKTFWISLLSLLVIGFITLGIFGIPAKSVTISKSIPNDRLPQ